MLSRDADGLFSFSCPYEGFSRNNTHSWFEAGPWSAGSYNTSRLQYLNKGIFDWGVFAYLSEAVIGDSQTLPKGTVLTGSAGNQSSSFILRCSSQIFDSTYGWENGCLNAPLEKTNSNSTVLDTVLGLFRTDFTFNDESLGHFRNHLYVGEVLTSNVTEQFATLLSRITLSFLGGCLEPRLTSTLELQNDQTVLTVVPKAALYILIFLNVWYAGLGFFLFLVACFVSAYQDRGPDIRAVQKLLIVTGLTVTAVSRQRLAQGKNLRVGVEKLEGKWHFKVWHPTDDEEKSGRLGSDDTLAPSKSVGSGPTKNQVIVDAVSVDSALSGKTAGIGPLASPQSISGNGDTAHSVDIVPLSPVSDQDEMILGDLDARLLTSQGLLWAESSSQVNYDENTLNTQVGDKGCPSSPLAPGFQQETGTEVSSLSRDDVSILSTHR